MASEGQAVVAAHEWKNKASSSGSSRVSLVWKLKALSSKWRTKAV